MCSSRKAALWLSPTLQAIVKFTNGLCSSQIPASKQSFKIGTGDQVSHSPANSQTHEGSGSAPRQNVFLCWDLHHENWSPKAYLKHRNKKRLHLQSWHVALVMRRSPFETCFPRTFSGQDLLQRKVQAQVLLAKIPPSAIWGASESQQGTIG